MANELLPIVKAMTPEEAKSAVGGTLAEVWHALIGDRVSAYRMRNAAQISKKLAAILDEGGHTVNWERVPDRFAITWFEQATKEDEPSIQDLFATLLSRAAQGCEDALEKRNVDIVARLSPSDAKLLQAIYEEYSSKYAETKVGEIWLDSRADFTLTSEGRDIDQQSYENLQNLGIIDAKPIASLDTSQMTRWLHGQTGMEGGGGLFTNYPLEHAVLFHDEIYLTQTGRSLLQALY